MQGSNVGPKPVRGEDQATRIRNDWPLVFVSRKSGHPVEAPAPSRRARLLGEASKRLPIPMPPRPSLRGRFGRHIRFALRLIQETRNGTFIRGSSNAGR